MKLRIAASGAFAIGLAATGLVASSFVTSAAPATMHHVNIKVFPQNTKVAEVRICTTNAKPCHEKMRKAHISLHKQVATKNLDEVSVWADARNSVPLQPNDDPTIEISCEIYVDGVLKSSESPDNATAYCFLDD